MKTKTIPGLIVAALVTIFASTRFCVDQIAIIPPQTNLVPDNIAS